MIDNEKRAHDLDIACMPLAMAEVDEKCFNFPVPEFEGTDASDDYANVNPCIVQMYLNLYSAFLDQLHEEPSRICH